MGPAGGGRARPGGRRPSGSLFERTPVVNGHKTGKQCARIPLSPWRANLFARAQCRPAPLFVLSRAPDPAAGRAACTFYGLIKWFRRAPRAPIWRARLRSGRGRAPPPTGCAWAPLVNRFACQPARGPCARLKGARATNTSSATTSKGWPATGRRHPNTFTAALRRHKRARACARAPTGAPTSASSCVAGGERRRRR